MYINILIDNPKSWIVPYAKIMVETLRHQGHKINFVYNQNKIKKGDCLFLLSCEKIISKKILSKNKHNLVVHESALPKGKGWSPLTWQILEGKNKIVISLFKANNKIDSGDIYLQKIMFFKGHELIDELRKRQGEKTIELVERYVNSYKQIVGRRQTGKETFYKKRTTEDSELDVNKTIAKQFNLLRVVDNERYPAFFKYKNKKYILKIYRA